LLENSCISIHFYIVSPRFISRKPQTDSLARKGSNRCMVGKEADGRKSKRNFCRFDSRKLIQKQERTGVKVNMKRYMVALIALAFATTVVMAQEKSTEKPVAKEMTLTGKLDKTTKQDGDKEIVRYVLVTADYGTVKLPAKTEVKLEELVGKNVEVVVKAFAIEKDGKKFVEPMELISAKEVKVEEKK
jgi:hypothetical protein